MIRIVGLLLIPGILYANTGATITGNVSNETTKRPVKAEWVVLVKTGQGLETLQQFENVSSYAFKDVPLLSGMPYLVRAYYQGVLYTQNILVQESKEYVVNLSVYESSERWAAMTVRVPHLVIVRQGNQLEIQHTFEIQNSGNTTFNIKGENNPTFRFELPPGAAMGQVTTSHNRSMPVVAPVIDGKGWRGVHFPIRPGATQIQISYTAAYNDDTFEFRTPIFYDISECNVFVSPADMRLNSAHLVQHKDDQLASNNFAVYASGPLKSSSELMFRLSGGTVVDRAAHGEEKIIAYPSRIQKLIWIILPSILAVCMFALFFALQKSVVDRPSTSATAGKSSRKKKDISSDLTRQQEKLAGRIAALDDAFDEKKLKQDDYQRQRAELKTELRRVAQALEKAR